MDGDAGNLFASAPARLDGEQTTDLIANENLRIERIVSTGQASPPGFWYDQDWAELVLLLAGSAGLLAEGAARVPGKAIPRICPAVPVAVSADPDRAAAMASWWIAFYLTRMGPLYRDALRRTGFGTEADLVVAGGPPPRGGTARLAAGAEVLVDELTVHGDAAQARAGLDRWYRAGAEMPAVVLPPNQPVDDLLHTVESLRPVELTEPTVVHANAGAP